MIGKVTLGHQGRPLREVTFKLSQADQKQRIPGRRDYKHKGRKAGLCLGYSRKKRQAVWLIDRIVKGDEVKEIGRGPMVKV